MRDARLIYLAAFLRATAVGGSGVLLGLFLAARGHDVATIGMVVGAGLAGSAFMTIVAGAVADRFGRRVTLIVTAALTTLGYVGVVTANHTSWLVTIAFTGMVNGMGRDRGPAGALEQAIVPDTTEASRRTWALAWYNVTLDAAHAAGALSAAVPAILRTNGMSVLTAYRATFVLYAAAVAAGGVVYALLSARIEVRAEESRSAPWSAGNRDSRRAVRRLAFLFGVDSLAGGFLSSALIAYWFLRRHGLSETDLAVLFFVARVLNALSHVGAAWLARRIGLLNTMVFTHLPSSVLLMLTPLAPSAWLAVLLFLCREGLVEMDVPTRQSYVMAIVPRIARTRASAVTNVTRTAGWAMGSTIAGWVMAHLLFAPLVIAAVLKIGYDIVLYRSFRRVVPREEIPGAV